MSRRAASGSTTSIGPVHAGADRLRRPGLSSTSSGGARKIDQILEVVVLHRFSAESRQTVLHIGGIGGLGHLAVVDDAHPGIDLAADDLSDRRRDTTLERLTVDRDTISNGPHQLDEVIGTRQAAGVGAGDSMVGHGMFLVDRPSGAPT